MRPPEGPIIGIDLGTTHSLCSVFREGEPTLVPNVHGEFLTPSVVAKSADGRVIVGATARELRETRPEQCAWNFKRLMGTDQLMPWADAESGAIALSSFVLSSLKEDAEAYLEQPVQRAVITVPAYFNEHQRRATRLAARLAGLEVERILNEPTAAALAFGMHRRSYDGYLMIVDIGGGTCDLALMETFEGVLEILASAGLANLGGEDFTARAVARALQADGCPLELAELREPRRVARLWSELEAAKCRLADVDATRYCMPDEAGAVDEADAERELSRADFAAQTRELLDRIERPLEQLLRDADIGPERIDEIVLVGGATRMPEVSSWLQERLLRTPVDPLDPERAVALGAAVQAGLLEQDQGVSDLVLTDVCPHTLGVEIVKEFGKQTVDGYFLPVLHRNTTIPVSREEFVATIQPDQEELLIRIFQGESRRTADNLLLGELRVRELPPGPVGMQVAVRFTYDLNGLLEVEARVSESGLRVATLITSHVEGLGEEAIARAAAQLEAIKFYPRDELGNLRLVHFAESVLGKLAPREREELEELVDAFERAMNRSSRQLYAAARRMLMIYLASLGYPPLIDSEPDQEASGWNWSDAA